MVTAAPIKTHTHVITVINDNRQEQWEYTLDENDEVVSQRLLPRDTPRLEAPAPTPAAPSLTNPPAPTETPPANPQPAGSPKN